MTFFNESRTDRGVRAVGGIVLLATAWAVSSNAIGFALFVIGAIALGTASLGWCPAYWLLGRSTVKSPDGHCPNCETRGSSYN